MAKQAGYCAASDASVLEAIFGKTCKLKKPFIMYYKKLFLTIVAPLSLFAADNKFSAFDIESNFAQLPPEAKEKIVLYARPQQPDRFAPPPIEIDEAHLTKLQTIENLPHQEFSRGVLTKRIKFIDAETIVMFARLLPADRKLLVKVIRAAKVGTTAREAMIDVGNRYVQDVFAVPRTKNIALLSNELITFHDSQGTSIKTIPAPKFANHFLGVTPDEKSLLYYESQHARHRNAGVNFIDLATLQVTKKIPNPTDSGLAAAYNPKKNILAFDWYDSRITLMHNLNPCSTTDLAWKKQDSPFHIQEIIFSPDGAHLAALGLDNQLVVFDIREQNKPQMIFRKIDEGSSYGAVLNFISNNCLLYKKYLINLKNGSQQVCEKLDGLHYSGNQKNLVLFDAPEFSSTSWKLAKFSEFEADFTFDKLNASQKMFLKLLIGLEDAYKKRVVQLKMQDPAKYGNVLGIKMSPQRVEQRTKNITAMQFITAFNSFANPDGSESENQRYLKERFLIDIDPKDLDPETINFTI